VSTNDREQNEAERVGLPGMHDPGIYRLLVAGRLGPVWKDRFEGLVINERTNPDPRGITELTVPVSDQTALLGVLEQLADMQCALLSLELTIEGQRLDNQPQTRPGEGN
jgi:hypothetical protein